MDRKEIIDTLHLMAAGIDPTTGEVAAGDVLQEPLVIRALYAAVRLLEQSPPGARRERRGDLPANVGKPWTGEDDSKLLEGFDQGRAIADLAREHARTRGAVRSRLLRLGKLVP